MRRSRLSFPCYERCAILCHVLEEKKKTVTCRRVLMRAHVYFLHVCVHSVVPDVIVRGGGMMFGERFLAT